MWFSLCSGICGSLTATVGLELALHLDHCFHLPEFLFVVSCTC